MAQQNCEENGMESLTINSKDEENHFLAMIQQNDNVPKSLYHVGGLLEDDEWKWNSDSSITYPRMKWANGEPNNHLGNEKCLSINKGTLWAETGFNDINCEIHKGFFCQKPKNQKSSQSSEESVESEETTTETQAVPVTEEISTQKEEKLDLTRQLKIQKDLDEDLERQLENKMSIVLNLESKLRIQTARDLILSRQLVNQEAKELDLELQLKIGNTARLDLEPYLKNQQTKDLDLELKLKVNVGK